MIRYPLKKLLILRTNRKNTLKSMYIIANNNFEKAVLKVDEITGVLQKFRDDKQNTIDLYYNCFENTLADSYSFHDLRFKIEMLNDEEMHIVKELSDALDNQQQLKTQKESAYSLYMKAMVNERKIEVHRDLWVQTADKELQLSEEKELEEFNAKRVG